MAGKLGLAAKIFLGTTVLAGGGAGTWYASTNGLPAVADLLSSRAAADVDAKAPIEDPHAAPIGANLDAVAGAWGESAGKTAEALPESSPVARSADITTAAEAPSEGDARAESSLAGNRYAVADSPSAKSVDTIEPASAEPVASEAGPSELAQVEASPTASEQAASQPELAPRAAVANEPEVADVAETTAVESPEPASSVETAAVARGQEPSDETKLQPLEGTANEADVAANSTADPARQAFESTPQAAGGRYAAAASDGTAASPTDGGKTGVVNPFSAAGDSSKTQTAPANQTIEPLPPESGPAELSDLPTSNELRPLRSSAPASRTPAAGSPNELRGAGTSPQPESFGATDLSPLPAGNERAASDNLGATAASEGAGTPGEKALEGLQRPSLEIQKFAPPEIQVGKPAKFVVRVRNLGTQAAEGVVIRDQVPQGTKLLNTTPEAQSAGGGLLWDLGKLSPGEDRVVEMQVMPVAEGEIGSVATVSCSAQASVKTKCTMPQLAIRMTAPAKVMVGQEQRVKIELRNPGSGDASGVMLFENVPQNVKHAAGPALEFEIGTLKAGETRELELVLLAEKPGKTVNVLSARADGNLQVQQQVEFEVIAPGLSVGVDGPERRYLERPATYEVRVENPGTAPAHNVQIVTKLPKGMRFIKANNKGEYDSASHAVYWSLAELPEGDHGVVELVAMPIEAGPQTLEVEGRAAQGLSDQTQRQIMIDGLAAIMFEVKDLEDPIEVGGETGYDIRVVNQGTKAATNVQVAVNLPPGMQLVSAEGETQHAEQRGVIVFEPLAQLAAKADTVYRIRVQGTAAGDQRVTVQVNTDDLAQPIRREESTLVYGDE